VEAGRKLQELVAKQPFQDGFLSANQADEATNVANELAAMVLQGHWAFYQFKDYAADGVGPGDKIGWFPFPAVEGGAGDPTDALGGGDCIAVGVNAPPEAVDFLRWCCTPCSCCIPSFRRPTTPPTTGTAWAR